MTIMQEQAREHAAIKERERDMLINENNYWIMKNKPRSLPAANNGVSSLLVLIASLLTTAECTIDVLIEGFFKNKEINIG